MLQQPAAEWMLHRQATADSLLKAQPHSPEQATNGTYTDLGAAAGLTVILLAVFDADGLELVNLVLRSGQPKAGYVLRLRFPKAIKDYRTTSN